MLTFLLKSNFIKRYRAFLIYIINKRIFFRKKEKCWRKLHFDIVSLLFFFALSILRRIGTNSLPALRRQTFSCYYWLPGMMYKSCFSITLSNQAILLLHLLLSSFPPKLAMYTLSGCPICSILVMNLNHCISHSSRVLFAGPQGWMISFGHLSS